MMTLNDLPLATALALGLLTAYLAGSIPSAVWIGKSFYGVDVREKGSKNAGTTNTIRVLGLLPGIFVLAIDVLKGWFAVYMAKFFGSSLVEMNSDYLVYYQLVVGIFAVLGHALPVFARFKGGKGVATSLGVILLLDWKIGLITLVIALAIMAVSKYVSLGSVMAALVFVIIQIVVMIATDSFDITRFICVVILGGLLIIRHRANIKRLLNGTENKLGSKKKEA